MPLVAQPSGFPTEVTLANGVVLHDVSVVKWRKDAVVLKHRAQVDPIAYSRIIPEQRKIFEDSRAQGIARQEKDATKKAAEQPTGEDALKAEQKRDEIKRAIYEHKIVVGMTKGQVIESWGKADKATSSASPDGAPEEWTYYNKGTDERGISYTFWLAFNGDSLVYYHSQ